MSCAQGALGCKRLLQRVKGNEHQRKRVMFVGDENESPRLYGKRGVDQGYDGGRGSDIKEGGAFGARSRIWKAFWLSCQSPSCGSCRAEARF